MSSMVLITSQDAQARWRDGGGEALALGLGNIMSRVQPRVSICSASPFALGTVEAMAESLELSINARRHFAVQPVDSPDAPGVSAAAAARIERAFAQGQGAGLVHLATTEATTALPPGLAFARDFAQRYVTRLCHLGDAEPDAPGVRVALPPAEGLEALKLAAPPIRGLEYLDAAQLSMAWRDIEAKRGLAEELLEEGGERLLTEMSDAALLATVALDIHKACDA